MLWIAVHFPWFGLEVAARGAAAAGRTGRSETESNDPIKGLKKEEKKEKKEKTEEKKIATGMSLLQKESLSPEQTSLPEPQVLIHDQQVIQCNPAARGFGIHPGNSLATAQSLAPGHLKHFHWNGEHEEARLAFLAEVLYRFSSEISPEVPDAIVLEAGRSLKLFGDLGRLSVAVTTACEALGHHTRVRAAATPLAALALARSGATTLPEVPLQCLATGLQPVRASDKSAHTKHSGGRAPTRTLSWNTTCSMLDSAGRRPVASLPNKTLPNKTIERLNNMGLTRLGQVLALPRAELAHRFGHEFATYLDRLGGHVPDPRATILPPDRFDQSLHLLEPLRDKAALEGPMHHLLNELGQWLIAHQLGAEALVWSFSAHAAQSRTCMPVRFARAQQQPRAFAGISLLKLAETPLPEDVLSISLKARRLKPWITHNHSLFPEALLASASSFDPSGESATEPAVCIELLDQLGARLGESACVRLEALDCHTPDAAWRPLSVSASPARHTPPVPPGRRPLWLFTPPRPVNEHELVLLEGPERIQGQWWASPVSRDYYIASHCNGARCWAFVDEGDNGRQWYLHGYFA